MDLQVLIQQLQGHVRWGTGAPAGVVAAPVGALYLREDGGAGSTLYVRESGGNSASGWSPK